MHEYFHSRSVEAWIVRACGTFYLIIVILIIIATDLVVARILQVLIFQGNMSLSDCNRINALDRKNSREYFSSLEDLYQGIKYENRTRQTQ